MGMLRASGALDSLSVLLSPLLSRIGFPTELLPLALLRPFSSSGATGIYSSLVHQYGANSLIAKMGGAILGSTETTFYVLAVYFGVVNIKRTRHAIVAGLLADLAGILAAVWICRLLYT
jgi:spore maturation protein B